jgi:hypothetical protein
MSCFSDVLSQYRRSKATTNRQAAEGHRWVGPGLSRETKRMCSCNHLQYVADIISLDKDQGYAKVALVMETGSFRSDGSDLPHFYPESGQLE